MGGEETEEQGQGKYGIGRGEKWGRSSRKSVNQQKIEYRINIFCCRAEKSDGTEQNPNSCSHYRYLFIPVAQPEPV